MITQIWLHLSNPNTHGLQFEVISRTGWNKQTFALLSTQTQMQVTRTEEFQPPNDDPLFFNYRIHSQHSFGYENQHYKPNLKWNPLISSKTNFYFNRPLRLLMLMSLVPAVCWTITSIFIHSQQSI